MANISDEWSGAPGAILTGEEILIYAGITGLGVPAGMDGIPLDGVGDEGVTQRFEEATRALLSRGVVPRQDGTPDGSQLGALLDTLCGAQAVIGVSRGTSEGQAVRQYALRDGKVVGHTWDDQSFHLVADLSDRPLDNLVWRSAGLADLQSDGSEPDEPEASFRFSGAALESAAAAGEEALARLFEGAVETAGLDRAVGSVIASAMSAGSTVSAAFRAVSGSDNESVVMGWIDTGDAGLWSIGIGPEEDTRICNKVAPANVAANLVSARQRVFALVEAPGSAPPEATPGD